MLICKFLSYYLIFFYNPNRETDRQVEAGFFVGPAYYSTLGTTSRYCDSA